MATDTVGAPRARSNDFDTVEELGISIKKIRALLRAAINTGAGEEEDEGWLVGLAHDEVEAAATAYVNWSHLDHRSAQ